MAITEIIKKHYKDEIVNTQFSIVLEKKEGRGKKATLKYHDFSTGINYDSLDDLPKTGKYRVIRKESGAHQWHNDNVLIYHSKASDITEIDYDCVNYEGEKLMIAKVCKFDVRSTLKSDDETRNWDIIAYCYIDLKKNIYHSSEFAWGYGYDNEFTAKRFRDIYWKYCFKNMNVVDEFSNDYYSGSQKMLKAAAAMGWSMVNLGANTQRILNQGYTFEEFLKYKEPSKKSGPKQVHIDELVSYALEEVKAPKFKVKETSRSWEAYQEIEKNNFSNISAVIGYDKPICCYRTFKRFNDGSYQEGGRIYIEENGKFTACRRNNLGEWINLSLNNNASDFNYTLAYVNKKSCEGTVLEYLIPMFESSNKKEAGAIIASTLRHPCIEKLYKAGFKELILDAASSGYTKIWDGIESRLGKLNENGKTVNAIIGLNKNQLKFIDQKFDEIKNLDEVSNLFSVKYNIIVWLKVCFGTSSLTGIDDNTFNEMLDAMIEACKFEHLAKEQGIADSTGKMHYAGYNHRCNYYERIDCEASKLFRTYEIIAKLYPLATLRAIIPKALKLFKTFEEVERTRYDWNYGNRTEIPYIALMNYVDTYKSYLEMALKLSQCEDVTERAKPSPHFSNEKDVKMLHDDILPVFNYYQNLEWERRRQEQRAMAALGQKEMAEKQNSKWDQIKGQWDKWLFEDEEYVVVKPETPYDLVVEGTTLGHCVGGYINKVVDRKTNIMFIRKIQDPTKPLFTVEILSNGVIEQIHGRYNSNIDDKKVVEEEPNLTKFVATWVKEKKLELHTINKVR